MLMDSVDQNGNALSLIHNVWASARKVESTGYWNHLEVLLLTYWHLG